MLKSDLKQISNLLDEKLGENNKEVFFVMDKKFEENNKKIFEKIKGVKNELLDSMKEEFDSNTEQHNQMNKRFNKVDKMLDDIDETLEKKADKSTLLDWTDTRILDLELDRNKVKYLHIKEWNNLPSAHKINDTLIKEGLK